MIVSKRVLIHLDEKEVGQLLFILDEAYRNAPSGSEEESFIKDLQDLLGTYSV